MSFFAYFKSKAFFLNLFLVVIVLALSVFATIRFLEHYTGHNQFVEVPRFTGEKLATIDDFIKDKEVTYQVIDSIYDPKEKAGRIIRQDPEPGTKVKHNRTVYLYVTNMVPPQIKMPKLVDRSERQARLILESYGLKLGEVEYKDADCNGCIIGQSIRGNDIEPGSAIKKGTKVDITVGRKGYFPAGSDTTGTS
jgi:eukaryotic-like serine/threonine-protein kinase